MCLERRFRRQAGRGFDLLLLLVEQTGSDGLAPAPGPSVLVADAERAADVEMTAALALARLRIALTKPSRDLADQRPHLCDLAPLDAGAQRVVRAIDLAPVGIEQGVPPRRRGMRSLLAAAPAGGAASCWHGGLLPQEDRGLSS